MATDKKAFAEKQGAYGKAWALKYHKVELVTPNVSEIVEGLLEWYTK